MNFLLCIKYKKMVSFNLYDDSDWNNQVNGSLLPASVISLYCAYVCYTGLSSEPRDYACNGLHNKTIAVTTSTLILGMLTTVLSVLYSAVRAGSSTTFLSPPSSPKSGTHSYMESFLIFPPFCGMLYKKFFTWTT